MLLHLLLALLQSEPPTLLVDRDNVVVDRSCTIQVAPKPIEDADGNGVLQITGDGLIVDFAGAVLDGAAAGRAPDAFAGRGVTVSGRNVTIRNAVIRGFKAGLVALRADGLTLEDCDLSGNYRQRLGSTPAAEDGADWLYPHHNDRREWLENYGAAIYVAESTGVTVRRCTVHSGQNGLILDRVTDAKVYDNDFSFNSGWGIALWRSSRNVISRNALDFCIRGYSHGVYNRGQDSAGILMFEQNCENTIAENSATHGGDGFFGFAGREALGEDVYAGQVERLKRETGKDDVEELVDYSAEVLAAHRRRGNNDNLLIGNDFSYAAAHGIEMTFSFGNQFVGNRLVGNAICGVWGGYSQDTLIFDNELAENGGAGYGLERGGVNIEHGKGNRVLYNRFAGNKVGVHLWFDADGALGRFPWARANGTESAGNLIGGNRFEKDELALHFRGESAVELSSNQFESVGEVMKREDGARVDEVLMPAVMPTVREHRVYGERRPVGARKDLAGREHIIVTEWGPYDWQEPLLQRVGRAGGEQRYRFLGKHKLRDATATGAVEVRIDRAKPIPEVIVAAAARGAVVPYTLVAQSDGPAQRVQDVLIDATWDVVVFAYKSDPREAYDEWRKESEAGTRFQTGELDFPYAMGGPSDLPAAPMALRDAKLPREHFGTLASTTLRLPAGAWLIETQSDDGVRVAVDGKRLIDNWTWHGPTRDTAQFSLEAERTLRIEVEHFELDGFAVLKLALRPASK